MATTPEKKVKIKITRILDQFGVYYFSPFMAGFGRAGVPDIICCYKGRFIAIEAKAGKNTTTALQDREIERIRSVGGTAVIINEETLPTLIKILENVR